MSLGNRNAYSRKVYSHKRQERRPSPVPLFDQVFGMGKPVLTDFEQALDLSVKKVETKTAETPKTLTNSDLAMTEKQPGLLSSPSTDEDDGVDLLSNRTSFSDTNAEDISDQELSLIRAHMSNIDSEGTGHSSQSLTVTFVSTSASDTSSSAMDSLQPVETPRQAANASEIQVYSLVDRSVDAVREDELSSESPQERFDHSCCRFDAGRIRSSTPVNSSQFQLHIFDSLSTISDYEGKASPCNAAKEGIPLPSPELRLEQLQNNGVKDEEDELEKAENMANYEEVSEEDEEEEEEESFSYATVNEMTPPHSNKQNACPSFRISLKHSLSHSKKDKSTKLRSSRCIFPEESVHEQVTQSSQLMHQAKELHDYPLGFRQLTSTPVSFWENQDKNCLPPPAISTISITESHNNTTCPTSGEPRAKDTELEMLTPENQEKQDTAITDHAAGHRQLTSTPLSSLKNNIDNSCLPPTISTITILEPHCCVCSTELESNVSVTEPGLLATRKQEIPQQECPPSVPEPSSEGRIRWKSSCGRQAKRRRISTDETGKLETINDEDFSCVPVLKPPYLVGPDVWSIPYKTTEGQICEHRDVELCCIVRLPVVEENPVPLLQCVVQNSAITSYSPDFLESC